MELRRHLPYACRFLLGVVFIVSAILKFISVDSFEMYIYGFDLLPLWMASWLSRGVLFVEMVLGLTLVANQFRRWTEILTGVVLLGFTLFLVVLVVLGADGNCHCMGEAFELSPAKSIVKNVLLFGLLYVATKGGGPRWVVEKKSVVILMGVILLGSAVFSLCKLPYGLATKKVSAYNEEKFREWVLSEKLQEELMQPRSVIAYFSTSCRHCKMAMRKLEVCMRQAEREGSEIPIRWTVWGDEETLATFLEETQIKEQIHSFLDPREMLPITEFNVPLLLFMEKDQVVARMSNASFDESEVLRFMSKQ